MSIDQTELRCRLSAWRAQTGWTCEQVSRAIRAEGLGYVPGLTVEYFHRGHRAMREEQARSVVAFLDRWPEPGSFEAWKAEIARLAFQRKSGEIDQIRARAEAVEAEREANRRRWLAAEKPRLHSRWPAGIIPSREMLLGVGR